MGGEQAGMSSAFSTVFAYDDRRNCWMPFGVLPEGRHGTGAAVIGDLLYVPAGAPVPGGSRQSDSLFVFRPMTIGR